MLISKHNILVLLIVSVIANSITYILNINFLWTVPIACILLIEVDAFKRLFHKSSGKHTPNA
jgi:hypothetical protein